MIANAQRDSYLTPERGVETQIRHGTPEFNRTNLALFSAGFTTFALLYCVQPLLPVFARDFHVGAAESSLALSLTTGLLAPAMIVAGTISEARGRKSIMVWSLFASALLTILSAFAPRWDLFLLARAAAGLTFAGLPAVSMAYLSEEVHAGSIGLAIGLSIGGNGLGGMFGRLLTSLISDVVSWRFAIGLMGVLGLVASVIFWKTLPPSRHFRPRPPHVKALVSTFVEQLRDARLLALYAQGFLLMGSFVASYNYITYHLLDAPYSFSQAAVGFIFVVYLVGIFASAWIGARADRAGRRRMLMLMIVVMLAGILLTAFRPTILVILGIATVTFGFFGGHSVASSWVGLQARRAKAQAVGLYMFFYYLGSSVAGSLGGVFWAKARWYGLVAFVAGMLVLALAIGLVGTRSTPAREIAR